MALRREAGLPFVAAPVPGTAGQAVRPVDARYAVAVFRFVDGRPGRFGAVLPARERAARVDLLAALHQSTRAARRAAVSRIELPRRAELEALLAGRPGPWRSGPFAEAGPGPAGPVPAAGHRPAGRLRPAGRGGPARPGRSSPTANRIRATCCGPARTGSWSTGTRPGSGRRNGTCGWWPARTAGSWPGTPGPTGRPVDPELLEFYRLRWALDDLSAFAARLRGPHRRTADAERAWRNLQLTIRLLARLG